MNQWNSLSCLNESCPDHGKTGKGNLRLKERYGRNNVARLLCRTCGKTFSENRGTPPFRMRLPFEKLREILTSLVRGGSIRGTADTVGVNKNTVLRVLRVAGEKAREFNEFMLRNLRMTQAQCDEFWTFVGSKKGGRMMSVTTKKAAVGRGTSP